MTNQAEFLQHNITIEFLPYQSDMPYRIIVQNNPVGWTDPYGLIVGSIIGRLVRDGEVAGLIADTLLGATLSMFGKEEIPGYIKNNMGFASYIIQGWGGVAGINLGIQIAIYGSVSPALPIALAFSGGWIIGDTINDIVEDLTGDSLSEYMAEGLYILLREECY